MAIGLSFDGRYDYLGMDRTAWLLFGIVVILDHPRNPGAVCGLSAVMTVMASWGCTHVRAGAKKRPEISPVTLPFTQCPVNPCPLIVARQR